MGQRAGLEAEMGESPPSNKEKPRSEEKFREMQDVFIEEVTLGPPSIYREGAGKPSSERPQENQERPGTAHVPKIPHAHGLLL